MKSMSFAIIFLLIAVNAWANAPEEQIFEVSTLNGSLLSEPVIGFTQGPDVYLPLLDLGKILGVRIEPAGAQMFEIYKNEKDFHTLDFSSCPTSEKRECQAGVFINGIFYLELSYITEKLNWPLEVDLKNLRIIVKVETRQNRNQSERRLSGERPFLINRKNYDYPAAAVTTTLSSDKENNSFSLYESQPLFKHDSDFLLASDSGASNMRWTLSKQVIESDSSATASSFLKSYELGSTQTLGNKYLFSPTQVTGVNVSNISNDETLFDTQTLIERGPPRWKVELFLNDIYFGETTADASGLFQFNNVPLLYGQNRITYRLTSPLGDSFEIKKEYNVSSDFQGVGRLKYQLAWGQEVNRSEYGGNANVQVGLFSFLSAQAGVAQFLLPLENVTKSYHVEGLSLLQPNYSFSTQHITSFDNQETAWVYTPRLQLGATWLTVEHLRLEKFRSALINARPQDDMHTRTHVAALTQLSFKNPLTIQATYRKSDYETLSSNEEVGLQGYMTFAQSSLLVEASQNSPFDSTPDMYLEGGLYSQRLRQKLGFLIQNDRHTKTRVNTEYSLTSEIFTNATADIPTQDAEEGSYALGISTVLGELQSELDMAYSKNEVVFNLTLSTNLRFSEKGVRLSQAQNYRQSSMEVFAFIDDNSNNIYDPDEKPFKRLRITEARQQKEYETDDSGITIIEGLSPYEKIRLQIVKESITNIYLTAEDFQKDFVLTPTQQLRVQIPVKPSFDVKGDIQNPHFKKIVPLEIIDSDGKWVASTSSMSSGKFKFSDLPGGLYFIQVSPSFLEKNALISEPALLPVDLTGKAGLKNAGTLVLKNRNKTRMLIRRPGERPSF